MKFIWKPIEFDEERFKKQLDKLGEDAKSETGDIRKDVKEIVPTYQYEG